MRDAPPGRLTPRAVMHTHWQKRPLLVRRALPGWRGVIARRATASSRDLSSARGAAPALLYDW